MYEKVRYAKPMVSRRVLWGGYVVHVARARKAPRTKLAGGLHVYFVSLRGRTARLAADGGYFWGLEVDTPAKKLGLTA